MKQTFCVITAFSLSPSPIIPFSCQIISFISAPD